MRTYLKKTVRFILRWALIHMFAKRIIALILLLISAAIGYFVYATETKESKYNFKLGLDLSGGTHLVYEADTSNVVGGEVDEALESLRDVIEKRVNLFNVSEPIVQIEQSSVFGTGGQNRLIVELPGVTDVNEAIRRIGQTPRLEFRLAIPGYENLSAEERSAKKPEELFQPTGLTGQFLDRAEVALNQTTREPIVVLNFNDEGTKRFEEITGKNIGRFLSIFLDDVPISTPVIRQEITGGVAEISGAFTPDEARELMRNLNYGALPVPIALSSTQTIGSTLGEEATYAGLRAGIWAFVVVAAFLLLWYRLPGFIAIVALAIYVVLNLALFKLIPVTLTAAGIAGFILSLGMAVDANILIFERTREELARGKKLDDAIREGFDRAWLSIRDSNFSSIITAVILWGFAATSIIKGFALVFGIGVLVSMFSAISATRTLLFALELKDTKTLRVLYSSGFKGEPTE